MVVDKSQNLLKVKVLLLALHSQVVEGQVNHIHPGQGGAQEEAREVAACAARAIASWGQAEDGTRWGQGTGSCSEWMWVDCGQAAPPHHRKGSRSMYSGPWLHTEQKNK